MQDMNINEISRNTICNEENSVQYAGFFTRFAAFCLDSFITGLLLLVVRIPMLVDVLGGSNGLLSTKVLFEFNGWDIIIYLLTCLYFVTLTYYSGATIGKRLFKIKVISTDREKLSFIDVLYRETIGRFLCTVTMNMGYILVGIDKEKRGFHDMLSDTRVVYDFEVKSKKEGKKATKQKISEAETASTENVDTEKGNTEIVGAENARERRDSLAPSNYGYVPGSQKSVVENTWIETMDIEQNILDKTSEIHKIEENENE